MLWEIQRWIGHGAFSERNSLNGTTLLTVTLGIIPVPSVLHSVEKIYCTQLFIRKHFQ